MKFVSSLCKLAYSEGYKIHNSQSPIAVVGHGYGGGELIDFSVVADPKKSRAEKEREEKKDI